MRRRQHLPSRWLFTDERLADPVALASRLPPGTGVVARHHGTAPASRRRMLRRLTRVAVARELTIVDEAEGGVARVHDSRELRKALSRRARLIFVSSLYPTRSHPGRRVLPRMRAAALARLAGRRGYALGGMNERRFAQVRALGFVGWGGIDAFASAKGPLRRGSG